LYKDDGDSGIVYSQILDWITGFQLFSASRD
jgi:hypothetical protein